MLNKKYPEWWGLLTQFMDLFNSQTNILKSFSIYSVYEQKDTQCSNATENKIFENLVTFMVYDKPCYDKPWMWLCTY